MEVGGDRNGFHSWLTSYPGQLQFHLGDYGPLKKGSDCLHGVPKKIVSDRGTQITSHFLQQLQEALGMHLKFSSAYHLQTYGQTERTNQILEDMLRACVLQERSGWHKKLSYEEFSYNNSHHVSLKMSLFQALYGRSCRTPLL
jgi:transposase InsO family protein